MKNRTGSQFILTFAAGAGLMLAACSARHENSIVGKWKVSRSAGEESGGMVTFTQDGKVLSQDGGDSENGEYTLSASNTVLLKMDTNSIEFALAFKSPDEMTLTPKLPPGIPAPQNVRAATLTRVSQ
jgi:hypothetical protein